MRNNISDCRCCEGVKSHRSKGDRVPLTDKRLKPVNILLKNLKSKNLQYGCHAELYFILKLVSANVSDWNSSQIMFVWIKYHNST